MTMRSRVRARQPSASFFFELTMLCFQSDALYRDEHAAYFCSLRRSPCLSPNRANFFEIVFSLLSSIRLRKIFLSPPASQPFCNLLWVIEDRRRDKFFFVSYSHCTIAFRNRFLLLQPFSLARIHNRSIERHVFIKNPKIFMSWICSIISRRAQVRVPSVGPLRFSTAVYLSHCSRKPRRPGVAAACLCIVNICSGPLRINDIRIAARDDRRPLPSTA